MNQTNRVATTIMAIVILCLAGLGLILALSSTIVSLYAPELVDNVPHLHLVIDAILSLVSKIGLISLGVCMLLRFQQTLTLAWITFCISVVDSLFYLMILTRQMATKEIAEKFGMGIGFAFVAVLSASIYIIVIIYLSIESGRKEFDPQEANSIS